MKSSISSLLEKIGYKSKQFTLSQLPSGQFFSAWKVILNSGPCFLYRNPKQIAANLYTRMLKEKKIADLLENYFTDITFHGFTAKVPKIIAIGDKGDSLSEFFSGSSILDLNISEVGPEPLIAAGAILKYINKFTFKHWGIIRETEDSPNGPTWDEYLSFWSSRII